MHNRENGDGNDNMGEQGGNRGNADEMGNGDAMLVMIIMITGIIRILFVI